MQKQDPTIFELLSNDIFSRPTPADAIRILEEAGVRRAVLLSTAYFFMPTETLPDAADAAGKMRAENQSIVDSALSSNDRLIAFVAINPGWRTGLPFRFELAGKLRISLSELEMDVADVVDRCLVGQGSLGLFP